VDLQLEGHRAIVTGSSAGIGEAIARRLAAEGAAVIVHGRRAHAVNAVAEAIRADGGQAEGLTADLADPGDCARLISAALAGGDIDILVNNAGVLTEVLDNPTGRLGRPEEVADLVTFVASPLVGYINGANLRIDGGSTAVV
jgi:NAD(P)-dependent dehydrogenase (short-subunit alcohol dehydrogenase family)